MASSVNIICKRTVVSTKAIEPGKYLPLSVLDRFMEKNHIRMVYYYQTSEELELGKLTKKLRETLSEMLTHFPIVTGRLIRDDMGHWKIKCNDAGVRMVEAKAKGGVEEWLRSVDREKELKLVYWEDMHQKPYYWSTFYVQLTEFEEGGIAIGLSCTHLLADSICATNFMKAWADISLDNKMISPPIFHPLPPQKPQNKKPNNISYMGLISHYKSSIEKPISIKESKYTTISMGFSHHMVQACMSLAQINGSSSPSPTSTPFEALSGLFWVALSKIKGIQNGLVDMSICLNVRKIMGLDQGFFGNSMLYNKVHLEENFNLDLYGNKFPHATKAIRNAVAKIKNEEIMDLIEWFENNDINSSTMMKGRDLVFTSLEDVDPYLATFQDMLKPIHVSYYLEPVFGEGHVLILPTPLDEGPLGRVVMVTLEEEEAIKLCEDEFISQFSPNILMKCVNKY
ncbi:unnamed protein product [Lathyrus oleraceus]